ncbi:MAG: zinc-ribbon domain-containing protein [Deltaproteobacteria bacterium]|nr:zinc-ribbon domain-containing protein [Deltaproteobacteria bacterium]
MVEITCPQCNYTKRIPAEKIPPRTRWIKCPQCGNRFEYLKKKEERETEKRSATPWEKRLELGLWKGIKQTIKSVLFFPKHMFSAMPVKDGWREPLAFGLLVGSISSMCAFFWEFLIIHSGFFRPFGSLSHLLSSSIIFLIFIFLSPLLVSISIFLSSLIIHFLLLLVRAGNNGFEATLRVMAYSQATRIWSILPFIGSLIGWIWRSVVQIIGLKEAHETSYLRIIVAFSIPIGLLLLIAVGALFFIVTAISP